MKSKKQKNFRYEIILYSILSMLYTILTLVAVTVGIGIVFFSLGGKLPTYIYSVNPIVYDQLSNANQYSNSPTQNNASIANGFSMNSLPNGVQDNSNLSEGIHRVNNTMMFIFILGFIILTVLLFILYFLKLTKKFNICIRTLSDGIEEITQGNFKRTIQMPSNNEFQSIAEKINSMASELDNIIQQNRHQEDRKHELITSVAHDLRTPLTSIIGYLELLKGDKIDDETKKRYMDIVYSKSKRLEQLIEDLFAYTKYTYGDIIALQEPVDMIKLMEQLIEEFYPSFEENSLKYEFHKDCSSLISYADGNLLARAFANLFSNAIKYGVDGKRVEIYFSHRAGAMKILVKNYGTIIPKADLPHLFERFYRVEGSRSSETGGSGLGLAIARSIILAHRGEITAMSSLDGTTFEIRLPIIREPEDTLERLRLKV